MIYVRFTVFYIIALNQKVRQKVPLNIPYILDRKDKQVENNKKKCENSERKKKISHTNNFIILTRPYHRNYSIRAKIRDFLGKKI